MMSDSLIRVIIIENYDIHFSLKNTLTIPGGWLIYDYLIIKGLITRDENKIRQVMPVAKEKYIHLFPEFKDQTKKSFAQRSIINIAKSLIIKDYFDALQKEGKHIKDLI